MKNNTGRIISTLKRLFLGCLSFIFFFEVAIFAIWLHKHSVFQFIAEVGAYIGFVLGVGIFFYYLGTEAEKEFEKKNRGKK